MSKRSSWGFHLPKSLTAATEDTNNFFLEALFFNTEEEEERLVEEEEFLVTEEEEAFDEGEDFVEFLEEDLERRRSADSIRRAGVDEGNWARVPFLALTAFGVPRDPDSADILDLTVNLKIDIRFNESE